ncbi:hypothetical protein ACFL0V_06055 [Nanoarchaeota archaeon]
MYEELDSVDHILGEMYDFAVEQGIPAVAVDNAVNRAYWNHQRHYNRFKDGTLGSALKQHQLNVHIMYFHVRPELEGMAEKVNGD